MSATPSESEAYMATLVSVAVWLGGADSKRVFSTCLATVLSKLTLSSMILVRNVGAHGFGFLQFTTAPTEWSATHAVHQDMGSVSVAIEDLRTCSFSRRQVWN